MKEIVLQLIDQVLQELNLQLDQPLELIEGEKTRLFGADGILDSLMLVTLALALEQEIQDRFDVDITLANERAFSMKRSPFQDVDSLANYTCQLIEEQR